MRNFRCFQLLLKTPLEIPGFPLCSACSTLHLVLLIGLTGGIGSGKSTVAALLEAHGALIVDADAIAREVVEPGSPTLALLVERFGPEILGADGALNRSALASIAFASSELRKELE